MYIKPIKYLPISLILSLILAGSQVYAQGVENSDDAVDDASDTVHDAQDQETDTDLQAGSTADQSVDQSVNIDRYLEPIDGTLYSKFGFEYSTRVASNGMPEGQNNYLSMGVSDFYWQTQALYALNDNYSIRPMITVGAGSGAGYGQSDVTDDNWDLTLLDVNQQPSMNGLSLNLRQYVIHLVSNKLGILTVGRSDTFDRMATDFLALGSGVNNKFYQSVSGVSLYNNADKTYMGRMTNGTGAIKSGTNQPNGTGLRLWGINRNQEVFDGITYTMPYRDWLLQAAYSNTPDQFSDQYVQLGARYTYDALWARLSMLSQYASSWPGACQVVSTQPDNNGSSSWSMCQATGRNASSPYQSFLMGSKMSLGYVDASISYRTLFDYGDDANADVLAGRINDYYMGLDYTFMDASEFGPLTLGVGLMKQSHMASLVGISSDRYDTANASDPESVGDSKGYGLIFAANQKLGYNSGVRFFTEQFLFSAVRNDNSLKVKAEPVRLAAISLYTHIDQWHIDKRQ